MNYRAVALFGPTGVGKTALSLKLAAKYNAVTKEEIVEAAKKLTLDTVYVLKNK